MEAVESPMSNETTSPPPLPEIPTELNRLYVAVEVVCAVTSIVGNSLVLVAFARCRRLRTVTNYYVISLAVADLLVAVVGVPSAVATSVGLPRHFRLCLVMNSTLMLICTGSILSLVAVTVDRFWAIVRPLTYAGDMTRRRAAGVIAACWATAAVIGLLPAAGWNAGPPPASRCFFMEVMDFSYLAFVYFATIVAPSLFMAVVYAVIFSIVRRQVRKMSLQSIPMVAVVNPGKSTLSLRCGIVGAVSSPSAAAASPSSGEARAAKGIAVIVVLFVVSWLPLYTINTLLYFCPRCLVPQPIIDVAIVLSHCNSAWNPALYAWGVRDFRAALRQLVCPTSRGSTTAAAGKHVVNGYNGNSNGTTAANGGGTVVTASTTASETAPVQR